MIRNAFAYVTRKKLKSLIIIVIIATMSTFCVLGLGIKKATDVSSKKSLGNITNSILLEINRQVNPGTPRGGGNVKERDINRIAQCKEIYSYVKRIALFKKIVALSNLIQRIYHNDIRNMLL